MSHLPTLGVDVGGTHVRAGIVERGRVLEEVRVSARLSRVLGGGTDAALEEVLETIARVVTDVLRRSEGAAAVGVAFPGFLDPRTGRLSQSPNLPGLRDTDLRELLGARLGLPVVVENDGLAAAVGERALSPVPVQDLLYVGLGTGVGGGAVLGGRPWRGSHGVALELGHLIVEPGGRPCGCGNHGCLEQYASASGVTTSFEESTGERAEADDIARRARAGDGPALTSFHRAGTALGAALAHVAKVLDVEDVVVGGGLSQAWELLAPAFTRRLEHDVLPVQRGRIRVRASTSKDQAGMLGAGLLATGLGPPEEGHGQSRRP